MADTFSFAAYQNTVPVHQDYGHGYGHGYGHSYAHGYGHDYSNDAIHSYAYAVPFYGDGHYTIDGLEQYLHGYVDHAHQDWKTLLSSMLDFAVDNMQIGMQHIDEHPSSDDHQLHTFFDDTVRALILSKSLTQNGYHTADFLQKVEREMTVFKNDLLSNGSQYDHMLADYLNVALHEVNIARYLEESNHAEHLADVHHAHAHAHTHVHP